MSEEDQILAEQIAYYRAAATEYGVDPDAARKLVARKQADALDSFRPGGRRCRKCLMGSG